MDKIMPQCQLQLCVRTMVQIRPTPHPVLPKDGLEGLIICRPSALYIYGMLRQLWLAHGHALGNKKTRTELCLDFLLQSSPFVWVLPYSYSPWGLDLFCCMVGFITDAILLEFSFGIPGCCWEKESHFQMTSFQTVPTQNRNSVSSSPRLNIR